jgi:hypothetical protein
MGCFDGWGIPLLSRNPSIVVPEQAGIEDPGTFASSLYSFPLSLYRHPREGGDPGTFVQVAAISYL